MPTTRTPASGASQWFRQAIDMFQAAAKAGLQFQEESARIKAENVNTLPPR